MKNYTHYDLWRQGADGYTNEGSFLTSLLRTYQAADFENQTKLKEAFPEYFVEVRKSIAA